MTRRYRSFLVRCWDLGDHERRIEVRQIQTGESTRVSSMSAASTWIERRCHEPEIEARDAAAVVDRPEDHDASCSGSASDR
jgi:hypothetical protein